jgi:hypothetical protein
VEKDYPKRIELNRNSEVSTAVFADDQVTENNYKNQPSILLTFEYTIKRKFQNGKVKQWL